MLRFRTVLILCAISAIAVFSTASPVLAADQPLAGQATLVGGQPLPAWGTFPVLTEGGFSGLFPVPGEEGTFWTVSDRGPNGDTFDVSGVTRRPFFAPAFTPSIYKVAVDTATQQMTILTRIPLHLPVGAVDPARATVGGPVSNITGFGNTPALGNPAANVPVPDETPTTDDAATPDGDVDVADPVLPFDPYGLDTEGVVLAADGTFWLVEEYRPSIIHVAADGTILQRYTPNGQNATNLGASWSAVPLADILPAAYSTRRANRGFEGVAINGNTLYAIMQNSLATTCAVGVSNNNRSAVRIAKVDITDPANPVLVGDFLYTLDVSGSGNAFNSQIRISDLYWVGPGDKLLVDERDDTAGTAGTGGPSTTRKRIYQVDLTGATNIQSLSAANQDCIDALKPADVLLRGATPGTKTLVLDVGATTLSPEYPFAKLEGLVKRANGNFATMNDNDFNIVISGNGSIATPMTFTAGTTATKYIEYGTGTSAQVPESRLVVLLPVSVLALGLAWFGFARRKRVHRV